MPKLQPLLDEGAGELERWLLESALKDGPASDEARERTLAAVRLATGATAGAGAGALVVKSRLFGSALLKKWLLLGGVSVSAVGAGVYGLSAGAPDSAPAVVVQAAASSRGSPHLAATSHAPPLVASADVAGPSAIEPAASAVTHASQSGPGALASAPSFAPIPPSVRTGESPAVDDARRRDVEARLGATALAPISPVDPSAPPVSSSAATPSATPAPPTASSSSATSLRDEAALLESVREMLARSDAASALGALGRYDTAFPRGALREEAAVLHVEALRSAGRRDQARALAHRFVEANPSSSYAPRMRKILDAL